MSKKEERRLRKLLKEAEERRCHDCDAVLLGARNKLNKVTSFTAGPKGRVTEKQYLCDPCFANWKNDG